MKSISNNIKATRVSLGLKQTDMAERIGVSAQSYNAWENNPETLSMQKLQRIADVLGVGLDSFFVGIDLNNSQTEK